ncbi:hypothetical protein [Sphingomonas panaciterrae]|uniref:hypothetical protein n=1 Tax=Sphingomonas panaciterrae TaxID=1462999 RepID=UPI002FF2F93A
MGAPRIKKLEDFDKVDAQVGMECRGCGRIAVYQREGLIQWFRHKGWNTDLEVAGSHFSCRECGAKWPRVFASSATPPPAPPKRPELLWEREAKAADRRRRG